MRGMLLMAAFMAIAVPHAWAQAEVEVDVLGSSILASFTASEPIDGIVVWFESDDATIIQHAVGPAWSVADTPKSIRLHNGLLEAGHTAKIGIMIQGDTPTIYWAVYHDGEEVRWGTLLLPEPVDDPPEEPDNMVQGIMETSEFYTIPEKPAPGSAARLVGSGFGPMQTMLLSIGGITVEPVRTDAAGGFVVTRTIPDSLDGRVSFELADQLGGSTQISIRLGEAANIIPPSNTRLQIDDLQSAYGLGDRISISGTATPLETVIVKFYDPNHAILSVMPITAGHDGTWVAVDDIIIPLDSALGMYTIEAMDGSQVVKSTLSIESGKTVMVEPVRTIFQPGQIVRFNGTATPGQIIHVVLQDPSNNEVASDSWIVGEDGLVWWEFSTEANSREGTYTLIVSQGGEREFVYAGLGNLADIPTVISLDKINYLSSEIPHITIAGTPNIEINILVLDDADVVVHRGNTTLLVDGRAVYDLDISKFASGVYTAIAQRGTVQDHQQFGVGLSVGSPTLEIATRDVRMPGDPILLLGTASINTILVVTLEDPNGNIVQKVETLTGKTGTLTEQRLRMPLDAEEGVWKVRVVSGPNSAVHEITVTPQTSDQLTAGVIHLEDGTMIAISGATGVFATITISEGGDVIDEQRAPITDNGVGQIPWNIHIAGTYDIMVESGSETVTFRYEHGP